MTQSKQSPEQCRFTGVELNVDLFQTPHLLDGCDTMPKLFRQRCQLYHSRTAMRYKDLGIWHAHSWNDYYRKAQLIGQAFSAMGLQRGDVIAILSEDNPEWLFIDMAAQCMGIIVSGVYTTDAANQLAYLVEDSGSQILFVENDEQLDKFLSARADMPSLKSVVVLDPYGLHDFSDEQVMFLDAFYQLGEQQEQQTPEAFEENIASGAPSDIAILVYTSGTTGQPKGGMISQANLMHTASAGLYMLPTQPSDELLCFLPLCHILERIGSVFTQLTSGCTINFAESVDTVFENMQEVSPHVFVAVPRVWEKIYSKVELMSSESTAVGQWAYRRAIAAGSLRASYTLKDKPVPLFVALRYAFWNLAVLSNLRRLLGVDKLYRANSGAAPISPQLLTWLHAIGIPIFEGYGMTETSGLISANIDGLNRVGSVGRCIPGGEVKIDPDNGEILYRGANVFCGYWRKPEASSDTMEDDWLRTGDVGHVDADNYVYITGRAKDIIITAGGKNITPAEIENQIKFSPYVSDTVVIGDGRKYLTALVMIDQENVEKFAQDQRVPFSDFASLCAAEQVQQLIEEEIKKANEQFARVEQIKGFRLIDQLLTAEDDELTATMKLKRGIVEKKYTDLIDTMY